MSIKILQELIRIPSYSGKEKSILDYIKVKLESYDLKPFFQDKNLLVYLKGKDQTKAFIFNAHVDVVDAGNPNKWIGGNPFEVKEKDGRIYGRGTSDTKGGVYTLMELAKSLAERRELPCDVWFTFVVQEETDGFGTASFGEWFGKRGYKKQYKGVIALLTEPTNLKRVAYGNRGNYFLIGEVEGESAHSSQPKKIKRHALMEMMKFIGDLEEENKIWEKKFKGKEFLPPSVTPTAIEAKSSSPNRTAETCKANFDLRTIPSFHERAFKRVVEIGKKRGIEISLFCGESPCGYTSPKSKIISVMKKIIPDLKLEVFQAAADLGFLTRIGIDGVIFGPGDLEEAHKINESASVSEILAAPAIFEKIYDGWAAQK